MPRARGQESPVGPVGDPDRLDLWAARRVHLDHQEVHMTHSDTYDLDPDLDAIRRELAAELDAGTIPWDVIATHWRPYLDRRSSPRATGPAGPDETRRAIRRWCRRWFRRGA